MPRTKQQPPHVNGFSERLVELRKRRGITQIQLARMIGSTQRNITHYETGAGYPAVPAIVDIAKALKVTTDELLGATSPRRNGEKMSPEMRRLWKKFQQVTKWPEKDQRAVIRLINTISETRT